MNLSRQGRYLLAALLVVVCLPSYGQATATIYGTVSDPSGAVVAGARILAVETATNVTRETQSNNMGRYTMEFLPVGVYRVEVNAPAFKKFVQTGIVLEIDRNARIDPVLSVGAVSESVEVIGNAPGVDAATSTLGQVVTHQEVQNLPLVDRDLYDLLEITSGVDSSTASNDFGVPGRVTTVNGSPYGGAGAVNYTLDGGTNLGSLRNTGNNAPNPDAVQEFKVVTNGFSAEAGRFAGGIVSVVTKTGTNAIHGSLFEYLRNEDLAAHPWVPGTTTLLPALKRNEFGGSVGGPIVRNRTFFFGSYQGLRQRQTDFKNSASIPDAAMRQGDFSGSKISPKDPLTGVAFPGQMIPTSRLDPTTQAIMAKWMPLPNLPGVSGSSANYETQYPKPTDQDEVMANVTHQINQNQLLKVSYFRQTGTTSNNFNDSGTLNWVVRSFNWNQQNANATHTWTLSPTAVNQFQATVMRAMGGRRNTPAESLASYGSGFSLQGAPTLPEITVSGWFRYGVSIAGTPSGNETYQLQDTISLVRGSHFLKIGVQGSLDKSIQTTTLNNYGVFTFDNSSSSVPRTGNAFSDFLLGTAYRMNQDAPSTKTDNAWYLGMFVQDEYRMTRRLTLNLGVRYDLQFLPLDPLNQKSTFAPGVQSTISPTSPVGLLYPGDPGVGRAIANTEYLRLAPRVSIAWDPKGNGKTAIRTGFGVFNGTVSGNEWNTVADGQPFAARQSFNDIQWTRPYQNMNPAPFPYYYNPASPRFLSNANVYPISQDFKLPYTYHTNFSVQKQVAGNVIATAAYVGALAHHLPYQQDVNAPAIVPGGTGSAANTRRPYDRGQLAQILMLKGVINSAYHALQMTAEKRLSRNAQFKANYTFSKSLDGVDQQQTTAQLSSQDERNLRLERARSRYNARHVLVMSGSWKLDYFRRTWRPVRIAANGWSLSAISTFRSGFPLTVTAGTDANGDGSSNNDRGSLVYGVSPFLDPNRPRNETVAAWFNTAAFVRPSQGTVGNASRGILDGPGMKNVDLGIFRDFRITESKKLTFRAEGKNALNIVNLGNPGLSVGGSTFGVIRSARDMRVVQLGLRLQF